MISQIVARVSPSAIGGVFDKATQLRAAGVDLIDLSVGEPAFDTPAHIRDAAHAAIRNGNTRYTSVDGAATLKDAIIHKFHRDNSLVFERRQIIVASGAKQLLAVAMQALLNPGDEVILPTPCWTSHFGMIEACGARPVTVPSTAVEGYKLTAGALRRAITPRTRLLVLTSPGNPTGAVYTHAELADLAEVLRDHGQIAVISDDLYEKIVFPPATFTTLAQVAPDLAGCILTVNGVSKAYAMTGWRIGYCGAPLWWATAITTLLSHISGSPCTISQAATIAALDGPQDYLTDWAQIYRTNRDTALGLLAKQNRLVAAKPDGAFYLMLDCTAIIGRKRPDGAVLHDVSAFCDYLLECGVVVVPGIAFQADTLVRISTAASEQDVRTGIGRILTALENLS